MVFPPNLMVVLSCSGERVEAAAEEEEEAAAAFCMETRSRYLPTPQRRTRV